MTPDHTSCFSPVPGDRQRLFTLCTACIFVATMLLLFILFINVDRMWSYIEPLDGIRFFLLATLMGGALAMMPVVAVISFLLSVWYGVESVFQRRSKAIPVLDQVLIACGLLVWYAPALLMFALAGYSLWSGEVRVSRAKELLYRLDADPMAYWQGIGFLLLSGCVLAFLANQYWRRRIHFGRHPR